MLGSDAVETVSFGHFRISLDTWTIRFVVKASFQRFV